jgi:hypothetical protein
VLPEALAEALALAAEEVELAPDIMLEAMLEAEDMAEEADMEALPAMEDIEEDMSIMEELIMLLLGAAVELAEPSQVAAVGRLVTPWPEQSEFANSMVSVEKKEKRYCQFWCNIIFVLQDFRDFSNLLFWSSSLQALLTQHERLEIRPSVLQMHFTSREPQSPKLVPTQVAAQEGRPGIWAAARLESRATAARVKEACMFASIIVCRIAGR